MATQPLVSREELLGGMGLPARQASALLFAIESRAARLADQSRQAMALFLTEAAAEARNRAFLDAIAQGGKLPVQPTIQVLERYAPQWAMLVADNPAVRAAVARRLGQKYGLNYGAVPGIRATLGLVVKCFKVMKALLAPVRDLKRASADAVRHAEEEFA
jgi:hypothetical protein